MAEPTKHSRSTARETQAAGEERLRSSEVVEPAAMKTGTAASTSRAKESAGQPAGPVPDGDEAGGVCVAFFDAADPAKAIQLQGVKSVMLHYKGNSYPAELEEKTHKGHQHIDIKKFMRKFPNEPPGVIGLSLADTYEVGCARYRSATVSFVLKEYSDCCCVPVPLYQLPETCNLKLSSYDSSFEDFIENSKAFLNGVEWTVTAVKAPITAHGTIPKFQPWSYTARSVEGIAEVPEIPLHQLYRIDVRGPEGYLCKDSATQFRYICCESNAKLQTLFQPCCKQPVRSVVFVRQECSGARWANSSVNLGGLDVSVDADGIAKLPSDMTGIRTLTSPGKVFNPPYLDLGEGATPVSVVSVSDLAGADAASSVRGRFVDDANLPFVRRPITVLLPNGDEVQVTTDDAGYFEAPHGSKVFAREDEWGLATQPIILKQS